MCGGNTIDDEHSIERGVLAVRAGLRAGRDGRAVSDRACHERGDAHQDHRIVSEMVWGAFRDQVILEYEVPKWDGGLTTPNVYVPLTTGQARRKIAVLMKAFGSQRSRDWFSPSTFESLMRLRGIECRAPSGYAEGFFGRKLRLGGV